VRDDTYIFEVAVYRVAPDAWAADTTRRVEAREEAYLAAWFDYGKEPSANNRMRANSIARYIERPYGWQYNEVIGWVRLLWDGPGPVIKGYLWQVGKKTVEGGEARRRYQRGFIPFPFVYGEPIYKVVEEWFDASQTDSEIYEQLRAGLMRIVDRNGDLPGRHIDLRIFDAVAPYLRWHELLNLERP
jgi:hypothetical protein